MPETTSGGETHEPSQENELKLEPLRERALRWDRTWGEIAGARPDQLAEILADQNEQIKRIYELFTLEMELGRPLTPEEIDITLHREKAKTPIQEETEIE
ncbi:MAG TPA: hypothetical protein VFP35_01925 [Candidatus Saccharimonadales bacterium]|nr:hypothetical protein [Candidatus Saccharimonadales bacterium]